MTVLYTAVFSMAPRGQHSGAPPDMLSGGGREILASYTAFSYQGNFSDVACRLIDTLPHQSPAMVRYMLMLRVLMLRVLLRFGGSRTEVWEVGVCHTHPTSILLRNYDLYCVLSNADVPTTAEVAFC